MDKSKLRWNGWGCIDAPDVLGANAEGIWAWLGEFMGMDALPDTPAPTLKHTALPASRVDESVIQTLASLLDATRVCTDTFERAFHSRGRSYPDLIELRAGAIPTAPDVVVYPNTIDELEALLRLAAAEGLAVVPWGGGSSVVGGVNPTCRPDHRGVMTVDMTRMCQLLNIDPVTMTAHSEAGIYGPALEKGLQAEGFTLGHYPQSFEFSTLGGWIAARGAGHQSNKYGKAEDWLAAARLVTPTGVWTTEDFPKSAAGPVLRDLTPGSEGTLGIICDAHVRIHPVPEKREYRAFFFQDFPSGLEGARALAQGEAGTAMVRLSDANETFFYSVLHGGAEVAANGPMGFCLMLVGFEGATDQVDHNKKRAQALLAERGGADMGGGMGELWLATRFETPYLRDPMLDRGLGVDTLETAVDWRRLPALHAQVSAVIDNALREHHPRPGGTGMVMAHVSHSYRTGASLYFTFVFPRMHGEEREQWRAIKQAASEAIIAGGGTISHHHGIGTDHLPWMRAEKGPVGHALLTSIKSAVDPDNLLNPGKLIP